MEYEHETPQAIAQGLSRGDGMFFRRMATVLEEVEDDYDVVLIDAPPQLGYLTLGALYAATGIVITVHPAMLDVSSMNQFLSMTSELLAVIEEAGGSLSTILCATCSHAIHPRCAAGERCSASERLVWRGCAGSFHR